MLSEGYYQDKFNYMNLHGDILFNVSNMIAGYNEDRIYDFVPFVGFGFAHSYDAPRRNSLAFNFRYHQYIPSGQCLGLKSGTLRNGYRKQI